MSQSTLQTEAQSFMIHCAVHHSTKEKLIVMMLLQSALSVYEQ